ncbi:MAG TPA: hypothetical protein P5268_09155 [Candidatus Marinimicrobia bacterium]|nr:hypothetical protein [Candidatus Neomarinimicrobiota bacterium]HRS52589.1 hypothetical protein [Candidatus Neomarinimicrobiota bacterium]HRU93183.1 hypothetical protein [Candidatus Neomarinimicrobiota bacterium]
MKALQLFLIVGWVLIFIESGISGNQHQTDSSRVETEIQSVGIYNIGDQIFERSNYIFLPYDDWGVKGVIQTFGLPVTALTMRSNGLSMTDPVYGQVPLTWLNPRFDQIELEATAIKMTPRYFSRDKVFSRFDYYRGDYGCMNFSMLISGKLADNTTVWRLVGENLGYDSYYGNLGGKSSQTGEILSQIYRLDLRTFWKSWQIDLNAAYQKYLPGYVKVSPASSSAYLAPSLYGNVKECRAALGGVATRANERDSTAIGFQQNNFIYGQYVKDPRFGFKGVADQSEFIIYHDRQISHFRLAMNFNPVTRSVTLRNGFYERQNLPAGGIGISSNRVKSQWSLYLGAIDQYFDGEFHLQYRLSSKNQIMGQIASTYTLYPLIYHLNFPVNRPISKEGFQYRIGTVDFQHTGRSFQLNLAFNQVNSDFYIPYKSAINDTTLIYHLRKLDAAYVTANGKLILPWRMTLTARGLISNDEDGVWLQGWGQIRQEVDLFKNNLRLYVAGELTYWDMSKNLGWFEELRGIGQFGTEYFTNNRLNMVSRIGARVEDFHIFYAIYNLEGRAFSTVPGANYRNRLQIFGVEWQFLD